MQADFITYRNTNMVVPPLDLVTYPDGYTGSLGQPQFIRTIWGMKSKSNTDKGAVAGSAAKAVGNGMMAVLSIGLGGGLNAATHAAGNVGDAISAYANSNAVAIAESAEAIGNAEKKHWGEYYFLQTFVPADGNLGELYKGKADADGYVGYCFYENGDYFEGYFYNNNAVRTGVFIFANGERMWGSLVNGQKQGECTIITPDGMRIHGDYENDMLTHGLVESEQNAFYGHWADGTLHGAAVARYADGSCFFGEWHYGQPRA